MDSVTIHLRVIIRLQLTMKLQVTMKQSHHCASGHHRSGHYSTLSHHSVPANSMTLQVAMKLSHHCASGHHRSGHYSAQASDLDRARSLASLRAPHTPGRHTARCRHPGPVHNGKGNDRRIHGCIKREGSPSSKTNTCTSRTL